ncbi:hypothetical protein K525DRAFT_273428 [Schizophyllum commune Loenen D]|nr:hypothetical protein K525DRAFT_273428 [Schizophyllum commune Loenen D]
MVLSIDNTEIRLDGLDWELVDERHLTSTSTKSIPSVTIDTDAHSKPIDRAAARQCDEQAQEEVCPPLVHLAYLVNERKARGRGRPRWVGTGGDNEISYRKRRKEQETWEMCEAVKGALGQGAEDLEVGGRGDATDVDDLGARVEEGMSHKKRVVDMFSSRGRLQGEEGRI